MSCLLGWRESFGEVVVDPVLPASLDGLVARLPRDGRTLEVIYRVRQGVHTPKAIAINGRALTKARPAVGRYRSGGLRVEKTAFEAALDREENRVEIEL